MWTIHISLLLENKKNTSNRTFTVFIKIKNQIKWVNLVEIPLITGVKIAVEHRIFPTDLIKSPISYVDKFSKMPHSKKKKKDKKILKTVQFI